jgi:hypothetical protein
VSCLISGKIAKRGKLFVDEVFVKECLQCAADIICPSQEQAVSNISLSKYTIARQIEDPCCDISLTDFQNVLKLENML